MIKRNSHSDSTKSRQAQNLRPKISSQRLTRQSVARKTSDTSYSGCIGAQNTTGGGANCDQYIDDPALALTSRGNFDPEHGLTVHGRAGTVALGLPDTNYDDACLRKRDLSGVFGENMFGPITLGDIKDGTSNTFMAGEVLTNCTDEDTRAGWWHFDDYTNARASVSVPLNTMPTCVKTTIEATNRLYIHPLCADEHTANPLDATNIAWGFRSWHPDGANFLMGDGSVQFITADINYEIYLAYGGRNDARPG